MSNDWYALSPEQVRQTLKSTEAGLNKAEAALRLEQYGPNEIEFKIGMYNFDSDNYTPGETRTIYYDNVSMLADEGEAGFMRVNPAFGPSASGL